MGGDRKRNKEAWSETEVKMLWEKRHGSSEPHITGQGSFSQSMALSMLPSGESWFPQLSTFSLQPDAANSSSIHFACLVCIITHTSSNKLGEKKASSPQLTFSSCWMGLFWPRRCFCLWFRHRQMWRISYPSCKKSCSKMSLGLTTLLSSWWDDVLFVCDKEGKGQE